MEAADECGAEDTLRLARTRCTSVHDTEWAATACDRALLSFSCGGAQAGFMGDDPQQTENYRRASIISTRQGGAFDAERPGTPARCGIIRTLKVPRRSPCQAFLKVQEEFSSFDAYIWRL